MLVSGKAMGRAKGEKKHELPSDRGLMLSAGHNPRRTLKVKTTVVGKIIRIKKFIVFIAFIKINPSTTTLHHHILRSDFVSPSSTCLLIDLDE